MRPAHLLFLQHASCTCSAVRPENEPMLPLAPPHASKYPPSVLFQALHGGAGIGGLAPPALLYKATATSPLARSLYHSCVGEDDVYFLCLMPIFPSLSCETAMASL